MMAEANSATPLGACPRSESPWSTIEGTRTLHSTSTKSEHRGPDNRLFERFKELFDEGRVTCRRRPRYRNGCSSQRQAENRDRDDNEIDDKRSDCDSNGAGLAEQVSEDSRTHEWNGRGRRRQRRQYAFASREAKYEVNQHKH